MSLQRVTFQLKCPNPLFEKWLSELHVLAKGTPAEMKIQRALNSLRKYPLPLKSGAECSILNGFGKSLCRVIDRKLIKHKNIKKDRNYSIMNITREKIIQKRKSLNTSSKKSKMIDEFIPEYRSRAYGILVALLNKNQEGSSINFTLEDDLQDEAQLFCDDTLEDIKSNASMDMSILLRHKLISKKIINSQTYFSLTKKGQDTASDIFKNKNKRNISSVVEKIDLQMPPNIDTLHKEKQCDNYETMETMVSKNADIYSSSNLLHSKEILVEKNENYVDEINEYDLLPANTSKDSQLSQEIDNVIFPPGSFDVFLLVDKQETSGEKKQSDATMKELNKFKMINYELRHLKVGDFMWIARHKLKGHELVLPYIVERKRVDDLEKSIKDGRFHEQKFRLKQCGVPNIIYLIESFGKPKHMGLPLSTLMQAITNTRIQDGFMTHFTSSLDDSVKFLAMMTKNLSDLFKEKNLKKCQKDNLLCSQDSSCSVSLMTFNEFNISSAKSKTLEVSDVFIKQLLQLKGMSVEKALAIVSVFKTPLNLMRKYETMIKSDGELLLSKIKTEDNRNIGVSLSKTIYIYFTTKKLS